MDPKKNLRTKRNYYLFWFIDLFASFSFRSFTAVTDPYIRTVYFMSGVQNRW